MIILCADDFGLTDGVSRAIIELCHARRLSATSALVTFDDWATQAQRLHELPQWLGSNIGTWKK